MLSVHLSPQQRATVTTSPSPSQLNTLPKNETYHKSFGQNNNNITVKRKLSSQQSQCSKNCCCCTKSLCLQHNKRSTSLPNLSLKIPKRKITATKSISNNLHKNVFDTEENGTNNKKAATNSPSTRNEQQQRCHNNENERRSSDRMSLSATTAATTTNDGNAQNDINDNHINIRIPIIGYEVMEERAKFTVNH